ncbi:LuxR C-terminal-related transcriptional regulator [Rhizobium sp. R693]|uniref:helix-turn-helix transcriptional regulator n=1 Tax=Rhizobium sp. R693 TaxID=1764276 RepID=UPI000B52EDA2|nr:LuxR C-terminal-related transcriptional regulator [Rhizobium sp. R693]OWW00386.1 hypothetical protein ATY79_02520 [Rhizobium sp. R693]
MAQKSKRDFNSLALILFDNWVKSQSPIVDPKLLYADIEGLITIKMSINFVDTRADDPRDWLFRRIKNYGVRSRLININKVFPDCRIGDLPDQAYVADAIIPQFQRVLEARTPQMDLVQTRIVGLSLGYDRIILPQKRTGKPDWCITFTEGRFLLSTSQSPTLDTVDEHIIQLLMEGQTAKDAAEILGLSSRTIEHRIEKLKREHDARNATQLVAKLISSHVDRHVSRA